MLVSATEMLKKARDGHYAVGQFNINNLEWTKAVLLTAQELNSPVILGVSEGAGKYMTGYKTVAAMVKASAEAKARFFHVLRFICVFPPFSLPLVHDWGGVNFRLAPGRGSEC